MSKQEKKFTRNDKYQVCAKKVIDTITDGYKIKMIINKFNDNFFSIHNKNIQLK